MRKNDVNKQTIQSYNKIAKDYNQINYEPEFWLDEFKFFRSLLLDRKVIDIGCGTGRDAILFTDHNFDYLGVDASAGMLKIAKQKVPKAKFLKSDFYHLEPNLKGFDGFWAAASLLHVPKNKIKPILKSLFKVIKEGGTGFISLKPRKKKNIGEEMILDKRYNNIQRFFSYYGKSEFRKILTDSGFKVVKITEKLELPENKLWLCFFVVKNKK